MDGGSESEAPDRRPTVRRLREEGVYTAVGMERWQCSRNHSGEYGRTWKMVELGEGVVVKDASAYSLRD